MFSEQTTHPGVLINLNIGNRCRFLVTQNVSFSKRLTSWPLLLPLLCDLPPTLWRGLFPSPQILVARSVTTPPQIFFYFYVVYSPRLKCFFLQSVPLQTLLCGLTSLPSNTFVRSVLPPSKHFLCDCFLSPQNIFLRSVLSPYCCCFFCCCCCYCC